jgi:hypothetical protein
LTCSIQVSSSCRAVAARLSSYRLSLRKVKIDSVCWHFSKKISPAFGSAFAICVVFCRGCAISAQSQFTHASSIRQGRMGLARTCSPRVFASANGGRQGGNSGLQVARRRGKLMRSVFRSFCRARLSGLRAPKLIFLLRFSPTTSTKHRFLSWMHPKIIWRCIPTRWWPVKTWSKWPSYLKPPSCTTSVCVTRRIKSMYDKICAV